MPHFNHGDAVICKINGVQIDDAKISIDKDSYPTIVHNNVEPCTHGNTTKEMFGYNYGWMLEENFTEEEVSDLKLKAPRIVTWENLQEGDMLALGLSTYTIVDVGNKELKGVWDVNILSIQQLKERGCVPYNPPTDSAEVIAAKALLEKEGYKIMKK